MPIALKQRNARSQERNGSNYSALLQSSKMKVKVSVTGGTGYIGSHTVVELIEVDEVKNTPDRTAGQA